MTLPANFKTIRIVFPALPANPRMVAKRSGGKLSYNPAGLFLVQIPHYPDFRIDNGQFPQSAGPVLVKQFGGDARFLEQV